MAIDNFGTKYDFLQNSRWRPDVGVCSLSASLFVLDYVIIAVRLT